MPGATNDSGADLEAYQPTNNQRHTCQPKQRHGLPKQDNPGDYGAHGAHAGPDGIGGAQRQLLHGQPQQPKADGHGGNRQGGGQRLAEPVGVLQADGPAHFKQPGKKQNDPGHDDPLYRRGVVPGLGA